MIILLYKWFFEQPINNSFNMNVELSRLASPMHETWMNFLKGKKKRQFEQLICFNLTECVN